MTLNYFSKLKKFFRSKKEIVWINSYAKLQLLENFLKDSEIIGLDTEFHWRNTYLPRVSLIQLVTRKRIFLIDCISLKNLEIVKKKLENRNNIIICHAVRSDSTVLFNSLNIKIKNIFDIQIADKLINEGKIKSYGELVKNYLGIKLKKGERAAARPSVIYEDKIFKMYYCYEKKVGEYNEIQQVNKISSHTFTCRIRNT